ncbi:MAG: hypothetical protein Q8910_06695 [Bacteroidota bacterium]|nr:hypothetical protein [Bacteroidota bacterium]MDP4226050.1 hypothetical protein [Bacteroidota bacterium]
MMNNLKKIQLVCCLVLAICSSTFCSLSAQNLTNSPYSMFGIGEIESEDMGWNSGMGSTGIGISSSNFLNRINPASYNAIDTLSFIYEFALNARLSKFESASSSQHENRINFKKLDMGFKVKPFWSMALGIVPFSSVGYKVNMQKGVEGSPYENFTDNIQGDGGITRVYWGNSINLTKHFSVGVNSSFLFGSLSQTETLQAGEFTNEVYAVNNTTLKNLYFEFGMQYSNRLNSHLDYTLGAVYANRTKLNKYSTVNVTTSSTVVLLDETTYKGSFTLPEYYGAGLSLTLNKKLTAAADYRFQKWSSVKSENGLASYVDSHRLSVGLQYIPSNRLPKNYFERIYYQAGASMEKTYLCLNGQQQNNYSLSAGLCFPLRFQKSYVHIGVQEGQKGNVSNILFRENYTLVTFGIVMHDFWFIKSKFD